MPRASRRIALFVTRSRSSTSRAPASTSTFCTTPATVCTTRSPSTGRARPLTRETRTATGRPSQGKRAAVGQFEGHVGRRFRDELEDERVVVVEIVAPAPRIVDAAAVVARDLALVVTEESAPKLRFPLVLAAVLLRQDSGVGNANDTECVRIGPVVAETSGTRDDAAAL